jgi:hypothetical protein
VYFVGTCRCCGQGLLGIRICCEDQIGLVLCEECDAIWLEPTCAGDPLFPGQPESTCPRCGRPIWHPPAHWASQDEVDRLDWTEYVLGDWESQS